MITKDLVNIGNARVTGKMFASKFVGPISGNADTATALTTNAGTATKPVYFSNGKPVATTYALQPMTAASASTAGAGGLVPAPGAGKQGQFLRGDGTWATPTNTTYSAATTSAAGLMSAADKSKLDAITASADAVAFSRSLTSGTKIGSITINGTPTDIFAPTNTDTHHTAKLIAGASATATANAAASNGSAYLNIIENGAVRSSHKIVGSGGTTVTTDANGVITIKSTDNNTTYTLSSFGITATAAELNKLDGATVSTTEINYLKGVTSAIQTQLNGKAASSHGTHVPSTCTTITDWNAATATGWYMASNASNAPTTNAWYFGFVIAHNANYVLQEVYQFTASTNATAVPKYIRIKMNGTWGSWTNVTVAKAVPSNAVFTDNNTTYGAATSSALGLVKIGSNITNSSGTISLTKANVTAALGYTPPTPNTTYSAATTSAAGLMTAAMVTKLNGIATGANAYSHPTTSGNKHIPSGGSSGQILGWSADGTAKWVTNSATGNYVPTSGGTVTGNVQQSGATTDYTTYKFRNIAVGTSSTPTSNATYGVSGAIYIYCS